MTSITLDEVVRLLTEYAQLSKGPIALVYFPSEKMWAVQIETTAVYHPDLVFAIDGAVNGEGKPIDSICKIPPPPPGCIERFAQFTKLGD